MKLTRGDALSALGAAGVVSTAGETAPATGVDGVETPGESVVLATPVALAAVLYPSRVTVTEPFVETYLSGRVAADPAYHEAVVDGSETLDEWARVAFDRSFAALDVDERERLLEDMGVALVDSVPDGSAVERVSYHLVDELVFAFYASPTGRALVGDTQPAPPVEDESGGLVTGR